MQFFFVINNAKKNLSLKDIVKIYWIYNIVSTEQVVSDFYHIHIYFSFNRKSILCLRGNTYLSFRRRTIVFIYFIYLEMKNYIHEKSYSPNKIIFKSVYN